MFVIDEKFFKFILLCYNILFSYFGFFIWFLKVFPIGVKVFLNYPSIFSLAPYTKLNKIWQITL